MSRRKPLEPTWFNRIVIAPLVLFLWIIFYPVYATLVVLGGFFLLLWQEVLIEILLAILDGFKEYTSTIKSGIKFIAGRIKNK